MKIKLTLYGGFHLSNIVHIKFTDENEMEITDTKGSTISIDSVYIDEIMNDDKDKGD